MVVNLRLTASKLCARSNSGNAVLVPGSRVQFSELRLSVKRGDQVSGHFWSVRQRDKCGQGTSVGT